MRPAAAPAAGLLARLRRETRVEHAALEARVPLLSESVSRADYVRFLTLIGAFHAAVEQELGRVDGLAAVITDLPERRKTALLAQDLAALGVELAALQPPGFDTPAACSRALHAPEPDGSTSSPEQRAAVPPMTRLEHAIGVLYVLEGSTLGGQVLHRHLSSRLPEVALRASAFLGCYGARTGQMWSSFRGQVERAAPELDADLVVDAAREAFAVLLDWFQPTADERPSSGPGPRKEAVEKRVA